MSQRHPDCNQKFDSVPCPLVQGLLDADSWWQLSWCLGPRFAALQSSPKTQGPHPESYPKVVPQPSASSHPWSFSEQRWELPGDVPQPG